MTITLHVTHDHILTGRPRREDCCPIAVCIAESFPDCTGICVNYREVYIEFPTHSDCYSLDGTGHKFVHDFDHAVFVQPTTVTLLNHKRQPPGHHAEDAAHSVCSACGVQGRPDDYGPHRDCTSCDGTGVSVG